MTPGAQECPSVLTRTGVAGPQDEHRIQCGRQGLVALQTGGAIYSPTSREQGLGFPTSPPTLDLLRRYNVLCLSGCTRRLVTLRHISLITSEIGPLMRVHWLLALPPADLPIQTLTVVLSGWLSH